MVSFLPLQIKSSNCQEDGKYGVLDRRTGCKLLIGMNEYFPSR